MAGPKAGQEVSYPELEGNVFWNDSAMFLFGAAIIADAFIHAAVVRQARGSRSLAYVGFTLAAFATLYNLYVAGILLKDLRAG